jgi:hypothetical protein
MLIMLGPIEVFVTKKEKKKRKDSSFGTPWNGKK